MEEGKSGVDNVEEKVEEKVEKAVVPIVAPVVPPVVPSVKPALKAASPPAVKLVAVEQVRVEQASLEALRAKLNTGLGAKAVTRVGSYGMVSRVSTGILELDLVLGINPDGMAGVPVGAVSIFVGTESSGKSTTALRVAGNGQRLCSRCYREANVREVQLTQEDGAPILDEDGGVIYVLTGQCDCYRVGIWAPERPLKMSKAELEEYQQQLIGLRKNSYRPFQVGFLDIENTFDPGWTERYAYPRCMEVASPASAEEAIDIGAAWIASGLFDLVIWDSLAELTPQVEVTESAVAQQQGLQARMINKMARRVTAGATLSAVGGRPVTQIWIQQWREKIGVTYGDPRVMPGGKGQRYAASVILELNASDFQEEEDPRFSGRVSKERCPKIVTACTVKAKCMKNKTAPPKRSASYELRLMDYGEWKAGDIDNFDNLLKMLRDPRFGIVKEEKEYTIHLDGKVHSFARVGDMKEWVRGNRRVVERAFRKALVKVPVVAGKEE